MFSYNNHNTYSTTIIFIRCLMMMIRFIFYLLLIAVFCYGVDSCDGEGTLFFLFAVRIRACGFAAIC